MDRYTIEFVTDEDIHRIVQILEKEGCHLNLITKEPSPITSIDVSMIMKGGIHDTSKDSRNLY